jgi:uncharacterized protein
MPNIEKHNAGSFCWFELGTTDQDAAKKFYTTLFGWQPNDNPMGPEGVYTIFKLDGRDSAAAYTLMPEMLQRGVPPHWALYVCVDSADATAAKVAPAGGTVLMAPFDVFDFGRMAVLQDPTGAVIQLWQPKTNKGTGINGVPGTVCWADLSTPDQAKAAEFYKAIFGWEISPGQDNSGYLHIKNGEGFIGGIPPAQFRDPNAPPHWLLYYLVTDSDAATAKAKELGARVYMEPMTMEGVGRWSVVADPQGAVFALFQPPAQHS